MRKTLKIMVVIVLMITITNCKSKLKPRELGNYTYKTKAVDNRGTNILVTAWGKGQSKEEALFEAKKNAIYDVIYKGIFEGNPNIKLPAIILSVNSETKNAEFNSNFFSNNGEFLNYVSLYDQAISQNRSKKVRKASRVLNMALEFELLVDRNKLISDLKNKGIIK